MTPPECLPSRVRSIGHEIFELAGAARPRIWQGAWWLEAMTRVLDHDERLRARAFEFVDCLPTLTTHRSLVRHLAEYFDPNVVPVPRVVHALIGPGPLRDARERLIASAARLGATRMAGRFITGYDAPSAIRTVERLRRERMAFTLDVLGEATTSAAQADRYAGVYHDLIDQLSPRARGWSIDPLIDQAGSGSMPRVNLSIKPTGLDPHFDAIDPAGAMKRVSDRLRPLLRHARRAGAFVNIDMEAFRYRDLTLALFKRLLLEDEFRDWPDVGIVVQAYLRDGERDLADLLAWGKRRGTRFGVRLVKGAYWDAETAAAVRNHHAPPVWTRKWETDACYERMTKVMLARVDVIRPAFASHNIRSLAVVLATAEALGVAPCHYEVQMLFGMGDPLKSAMVRMGQCVRIYSPYGQLMPGMGYLIRRLLENSSNEGFLKQSFGDHGSRERLLQDPGGVRPPSTPPASRYYRNTDPEEPMSDFTNASTTNFSADQNRCKMVQAIAYVRGEFGRAYPMLIDGRSVITKTTFDSVNPSNPGEVVGRVARATTTDVSRAVTAARTAFPAWRATPAASRAELLRSVAADLERRRFELAATIVLEVGKPWREADADISEAIDHWRYYADQIERIESRPRLRNLPGEDNMLTYSPKGVCGVLSPWAFPLAILSGMTGAALAAGNTVVIKPASQASVTAAKLAEIVQGAGFPPGVFNFVPGPGARIGPSLVEHPDVNVVAFTGSHEVGKAVTRGGAIVRPEQTFIKKMIVEMGGKNAIIIDDDADLDGAVQAVIESAFAFAGQKCSSCSRLVVVDGVYEALLDRLRDATQSVRIGPAEQPSTMVGPVIDAAARDRIMEYVELGRSQGRVLVEASLPAECGQGYFVAPIVIVDIEPDAPLSQDEVLGPVLTVLRARDFDHALAIANGTKYALTGGVFSRSPEHLERARRDFAVGNLYINRRITGSQVDAQPFGGFKLSGTGVKAGSPDYLLHFMDARCITENTARSGFVPSQEHSRA